MKKTKELPKSIRIAFRVNKPINQMIDDLLFRYGYSTKTEVMNHLIIEAHRREKRKK